MRIEITAEQATFRSNNEVTINLITSNGVRGNIRIDFSTLLQFAKHGSAIALDFFVISACVYGIDRLIQRKKNSVDGWSREMSVKLPVSAPARWRNLKEKLNEVLSFLTGDYWQVEFTKETLTLPETQPSNSFEGDYAQVNLFSGGLDSLIGAIDFLATKPKERALFISHYDPQMHGPKSDQERLIEVLETEYPGRFSAVPTVKTFLELSNDSKETTFRSRSLLFIGIALIVAEAKEIDITIPENGTVSLNYPLSSSRRSSCSTRTTHPTLISSIRELWIHLGIRTTIANPYEFYTKGELVRKCRNPSLLKKIVAKSNSCGKRGHRAHWDIPNATHCGACMPCIYRRASLLTIQDNTLYGSELNSLYPFDTKKGQDAGACLEFLRKSINRKNIKQELLVNGLRDLANINKYISVVERTRDELSQWILKTGNKKIKEKAGL